MKSNRALTASVLLAVLVIAAAGITGTSHFTGPRWVPRWKLSSRTPLRHPQQSIPTLPAPKFSSHKGGHTFPLGSVLLWTFVAVAVVGIALLVWRWWARRQSRAATIRHSVAVTAISEVLIEPEPEPDLPVLRTGIQLALQVLDEHRDPADAVVRAWLGLQETAEESGIVRQPAETPTEFTSRILNRAFADGAAIRTLLRLYLRTRFGDHPVTPEDIAVVRAALQELIQTWPAAASSTRTGAR